LRTFKLIFLSLFATLLFTNESSGQRDLYNWQISPYGGLLTLSSDIDIPDNADYFAYGLRFDRRIGNDFTLGLHLFQATLQGNANENLSGSFLSLGYHWDNGYLLSQRSFLSIFHRVDVGYTNTYSQIENIDSNNGDLTFGFESGLKFRFGDRLTADIALELLGTKSSLTEGDITQNDRYNVWKVGINYHFGSRRSNFVSPVFVPDAQISAPVKAEKVEKIDRFSSILVLPDTSASSVAGIRRDSSPIGSSKMVVPNPKLSRADSLQIFMHFDSLYKRRVQPDNLINRVDSTSNSDTTMTDTIEEREDIARIDSVSIGDTLLKQETKALQDTTGLERDTLSTKGKSSLIRTDTTISKLDTVYTERAVPVNQKSDTTVFESDTLSTNRKSSPILQNMAPDVVDTVYIEKLIPVEQSADTTSGATNKNISPDRVDTVYIERPAAPAQGADTSATKARSELKDKSASKEKNEKEDDDSETEPVIIKNTTDSNNDALQSSLDNQNKLLAQQNKEIQKNRQEIAKLSNQNKNNDVGKIIAAGAAGTALGALVSGRKNKNEPDTVYYESAAAQQELDRLEAELAALKLQYGIVDTTALADSADLVDSAYVADPPIGYYFENDSLAIDSTRIAVNDTLIQPAPTPSETGSETDSLKVLDKSPVDSVNTEPADTSAVSSPEPVKSTKTTAVLKGNYPIECNFGLNKTSLDATELQKLDVVVEDLKNVDTIKVLLTGYTDKSGNAEYNLKLSKQRATAVMDHLISKSISKERIEIKGGGISDGAEKFEPNSRRVEVTITEN